MWKDTFGTLLWVTDVPSSGNDPHHLGPSLDGKTLFGGGLLSLLKTQVTQQDLLSQHFKLTKPRTRRSTSIPPTPTAPSSRRATVLC